MLIFLFHFRIPQLTVYTKILYLLMVSKCQYCCLFCIRKQREKNAPKIANCVINRRVLLCDKMSEISFNRAQTFRLIIQCARYNCVLLVHTRLSRILVFFSFRDRIPQQMTQQQTTAGTSNNDTENLNLSLFYLQYISHH